MLRERFLTAEPFNQRDSSSSKVRPTTRAMLSSERIFATSGAPDLPGLVLHQLVADERAGRLAAADCVLLLPDLLVFLLTGVAATELTNASTTGLINGRTDSWDLSVLANAGIRPDLFAPLIDAGVILGPFRPSLNLAKEMSAYAVITSVASHDTASTIFALPVEEAAFAFFSCGMFLGFGIRNRKPRRRSGPRSSRVAQGARDAYRCDG